VGKGKERRDESDGSSRLCDARLKGWTRATVDLIVRKELPVRKGGKGARAGGKGREAERN